MISALDQNTPVNRPLAVVVNATAGSGSGQKEIAVLRELFQNGGLAVRILPARSGDELRSITTSALREKPRMIVAGGGDGTVSTVASLLQGTDIALGVLPLGTLNHFAKDLRIPMELDRAVTVLAAGYQTRIDVAEVNGRTFLNNSSLGIYPGIVRDRDRQQRSLGRGKRWALVWATLTALRRAPFLDVKLVLDGHERSYRAPFVFIGNNAYVMEGFDIGTREGLREGRLSVYVTRRQSRLGLVGLGFRALVSRLRQARDFEAMTAQSITVRARHRHVPVATDGEVALMETPLEYRSVPLALRVVVPAPAEAKS
jgi:diacylglycerol kinase family enzyme